MISRLNSACYAIRAVNAVLSRKALRMLYFLYIHSIMSYGIILGDYALNSIKIFRMQIIIIIIIKNKLKNLKNYK